MIERWGELDPHLDRVLDMNDEEKSFYLASLRAKDPALGAELDALLDERAALSHEGFLENAAPRPSPAPLAGQSFGTWTLVSLIGQGGMGNVWLARRSDGLFEGQAAVKLLNASLLGRAGAERFRREGSILARLKHPNIAHLIDAGVSPGGQPYLVLEHVDGVSIDRYCDARALGVEARVGLFLDVLSAVSHAHANLVVHRDIKPSNVLVAKDGRVKLLDFGIAKLLEDEGVGGGATALTREGGRALTPEFAAPEQVMGGAITTATDVYALGIVLYMLLGGKHPAEAALRSPAELMRAIVDTAPRPISDSVTEESARARATSFEGLKRLLQGDLDTIVGKALKKDPAERYATVGALAEDLRRVLANEPISARRDSFAYRAAKFVRRHRATVSLSTLAVLGLVVGLAGTLVQARRAAVERDFALKELSRATAINELNSVLLTDAFSSGKPITSDELLARAEVVVDKEWGGSAENRVDALLSIGRQYWGQDEDEKARRVLTKAYELAKTLPDRTLLAKAAAALSSAVARGGEPDRAEALAKQGMELLPDEPRYALDRVAALCRASEVARERGDAPLAIERAETARRTFDAYRLGSVNEALSIDMDLAEGYRMAGRAQEADGVLAAADEKLTALGRGDTQKAGTLLNNWALVRDFLGRPLEAEKLYRRALGISQSPMLLNNLARALRDLDRLPEAAEDSQRALDKAREAGDEVVVNQALVVRSSVARMMGDLPRAEAMLAELESRFARMLPKGHAAFGSLASEESLLAQAKRDTPHAKELADRAVALARASKQKGEYLPRVLLRRANLEDEMGLFKDAAEDARATLALWADILPKGALSASVGRAHLALGRALDGQGDHGSAQGEYRAAVRHLEPTLGLQHPDTKETSRLLRPS